MTRKLRRLQHLTSPCDRDPYYRWLYSPHLLELKIDKPSERGDSGYSLTAFLNDVVPLNKVYAFDVSPAPAKQKKYPPPLPPHVKYTDESIGCEKLFTFMLCHLC